MSGRRIALTLLLLTLGALGGAVVVTRVVACVALPVSEPPSPAPRSVSTPAVRDPAADGDAGSARPTVDAGEAAEPPSTAHDRRRRGGRRAGGGREAEPERAPAAGPRVVQRREIERVIADPSQLRGARVRLHEVNGEPIGIELSGIGGGSPLARIGLRNGDVLIAVNGLTVHDADGAIDAITRLRTASDFRVRILRGGAPATLRYRVE